MMINMENNNEVFEEIEEVKEKGFFGKIGGFVAENKVTIAVTTVLAALGFGAGYKFGKDSVCCENLCDVFETAADVVEEYIDDVE